MHLAGFAAPGVAGLGRELVIDDRARRRSMTSAQGISPVRGVEADGDGAHAVETIEGVGVGEPSSMVMTLESGINCWVVSERT